MNKLNFTFYVIIIITVLLMISVVIGQLDTELGSFYLGGAGFLILYFCFRTFLKSKNNSTIDTNKLNGFDKFCAYIGLFNGFLLLATGGILFIVSIVQLKVPTFGEITIQILALIYGYSIIYYIRKTLQKLN